MLKLQIQILSVIPLLFLGFLCQCLGSNQAQMINCEALLGNWKIINTDGINEYKNYYVWLTHLENGDITSLVIELKPSSGVYINRLNAKLDSSTFTCEYPDWGGSIKTYVGEVNENFLKISEISDNKYKKIWIKDDSNEAQSFIQKFNTLLKSTDKKRYIYHKPDETDDGWECSDLTREGMNNDLISKLFQRVIEGKFDDIHDILIVKNGKLVAEEYFRANGRLSGLTMRQIYRDRNHLLASSTKSITSALVGIATEKGFIENIDIPIFSYFPEHSNLRNVQKDKIQLKHLLTMTAGLEWEDPEDANGMWNCEDIAEYYLKRDVVTEPGLDFTYSNANSTLLGEIVKRASGMKLDKFADKYLFFPLGISSTEWSTYPDGTLGADGNLALRPRDLAKIGQLYLNKGTWQGRQIISNDWIEKSTKKRIKRSEKLWYGYQWWQTDFEVKDKIIVSFHSWGWGGQYLFVFPELDLIVVSHGGNFKYKPERYLFKIIEMYIIPSIIKM